MTVPEAESAFGRPLLGILLVQDVYLGGIVAMLSLASHGDSYPDGSVLEAMARLVSSLLVIAIISGLVVTVLARLLPRIDSADRPTKLLCALSICLVFMKLTKSVLL